MLERRRHAAIDTSEPLVLALALCLAACGSVSDTSNEQPTGRQLVIRLVPASDSCQPGQLFPDSLRVYLIDASATPVSGVPVTFTPYAGAASVSPAVVNTDTQGNAATNARCGTDASVSEDVVQATAPGITNSAPTFRLPLKSGP
jgi:hypothetical protein